MAAHILQLALLLGLAILVHELGHFLAARFFGIKVLRFSIGFPPKLFGVTRGDTEYVLGAVPLGGYVKLSGEEWLETGKVEPHDLMAKPVWVRIIMYASGVVMNGLMAFAIFAGLLLHGVEFGVHQAKIVVTGAPGSAAARAGLRTGDLVITVSGKRVSDWEGMGEALEKAGRNATVALEVKRGNSRVRANIRLGTEDLGLEPFVEPVIGFVEPFQPARKAGLKVDDRIVAVNGHEVRHWSEVSRAVAATKTGAVLKIAIVRAGRRLVISITPRYDSVQKRPVIGIGAKPFSMSMRKFSLREAVTAGALDVLYLSREIVKSVWKALTMQARFGDVLGGPVLIAKIGMEKASAGASELLHYIAILSVSLMVVNLLPVPGLDGGMILLALLEGIRGRCFSPKTYQNLTNAGFSLLIALFLFATYHDILRVFR